MRKYQLILAGQRLEFIFRRPELPPDSEETGEDVTRDDSWNYVDILWNGIRAEASAIFIRFS